MNKIYEKFRSDISGIFLLSFSLFVALSLYSYTPSDPSFNSTGKGLRVMNYCGYAGSFLADLFYQGIGLVSWFLVFLLMGLAFCQITKKSVHHSLFKFFLVINIVFVSSCLLALYLPEKKLFAGQVYLSGLLGLVVSKAMVTVFNFAGVAIILWGLLVSSLIIYFEKSLMDLASIPLKLLHRLFPFSRDPLQGAKIGRDWILNIFSNFRLIFKPPTPLATGLSIATHEKSEYRFNLKDQNQSIKSSFKINNSEQNEFHLPDKNNSEEKSPKGKKEDNLNFELYPRHDVLEGECGQKRERKINKVTKKLSQRIENWQMPKLDLLGNPPLIRSGVTEKEIRRKADLLVEKLNMFSVKGEVTAAKPGPAVTMYEFKPNVDVRLSKITDLADDLSLALSSESVRIIAPIPGRDVVGIETSNLDRESVYLKDILAEEEFWSEEFKLPLALGKQANGEPKIVDLRKMPHLLIAGTTGSGKSVFTVSILIGLLFRHSPQTLKLILIDPKQVDLAAFNNIPHLLMPPIREPKKAVSALRWAIREMDKRYRSMSKFGVRGLEGFNEAVIKLGPEEIESHAKINEEMEDGSARKLDQYYFTPQPYIVVVVEEFGDLMSVDKGNVEQAVVRLAQMARASGIHLILAMQSPRREVVTGLIKTNIPGRISFKVASKMDSRIILDEGGAERLLARGDMLFLSPGVAKPMRHHGPWIPEEEIIEIAKFWSDQGAPEFDSLAMKALEGTGGGYEMSLESGSEAFEGEEEDEFDDRYDEILASISAMKEISASLLQRKFKLGYPRAARLIEIFEKEGVVSPANGSKPRQVLINNYSQPQ